MAIRKLFSLPVVAFAVGVLMAGCVQQPQPTAPKAVTEPQPTYLEHTIMFSGETLADIATWYTGKATNWQAIRDANPSVNPSRLRLSQVILVPRNLVVNDKPFTKAALKRLPNSKVPEAGPTPTATSDTSGGELNPIATPVPT